MKCGLITFHRTSNFGSALQTYGLYKKIIDLGMECEIIDYRCKAIEKREALKPDLKNIKSIVKYLLFARKLVQKGKTLQEFLEDNTVLSEKYDKNNIYSAEDKYDLFMIGSDIVWGRDITEDDLIYFLDFVKDREKKFAFAASVGSYTERDNDIIVGELLNRFSAIAVREKEAIQWVRNISDKEAVWVCDPTMLLTVNEWEKIIRPVQTYEKYVLIYFFDDKRKCVADAIKYVEKNKLKVLCINYSRPIRGVKNIRPTSLQEFLGLIKNASFVFTASYHGLLFSLYYHKQFLFYTRAHSSRVLSLATRLGIMERCGDYIVDNQISVLDYIEIDRKIEEFRNESCNILAQMLDK